MRYVGQSDSLSRKGVAGGSGELFNRDRISVLQGERGFGDGWGDGCTTCGGTNATEWHI